MALDHKQLIKQQLNNVATSLGAPASGKTWYLRQITLFNTSAAVNQTVKLYLQDTSAASQVFEYELEPKEVKVVPLDYPWVLEATEPLYGVSTSATTVNLFVTGAEQ